MTAHTDAPRTITYRLTPNTPLCVTTATASGSGERTSAEPLERLVAAFYEDLHAIARKTAIPLWEALAAPSIYADQPDLLARLVSADVEQLLRAQLVSGVALVLGDRSDAPDAPLVRYFAGYTLRQLVSALPDDPGVTPFTRVVDRFDPEQHAGPSTELALLVAWYPAVTPAERAATITFPRYQLKWTPLNAVDVDDSALRSLPHTTPPIDSGSGAEWTRTRLDEQAGRRLSPTW